MTATVPQNTAAATATTAAADMQRPQPGDIILYPAQPGAWADALISAATRGPYVHCGVVERVEVSAGDGAVQVTTIEALSGGITRVTFPFTFTADLTAAAGDAVAGDATRRHPVYAHIAAHMEPLRIAHGLAWLAQVVGSGYSWLDIIGDALAALLPPALGARTPFLVAPSRYDCSSLAARYLLVAGYEWLSDEMIEAPDRVSPNDIARALNVIK